jgi:hypothetical protein
MESGITSLPNVATAEAAVHGSPAYLREASKAKRLSWASLGYMAKQRIGARIGSSATASEGKQNLLCAYLAGAVLIGLLGNALVGAWWLDPIVGLLIAGLAVYEGREAWRGDACCAD